MTDPRIYRLVLDNTGMAGQLQARIDIIEEVIRGLRLTLNVSQTSFEERFPTTFANTNVFEDATGTAGDQRNPLE